MNTLFIIVKASTRQDITMELEGALVSCVESHIRAYGFTVERSDTAVLTNDLPLAYGAKA